MRPKTPGEAAERAFDEWLNIGGPICDRWTFVAAAAIAHHESTTLDDIIADRDSWYARAERAEAERDVLAARVKELESVVRHVANAAGTCSDAAVFHEIGLWIEEDITGELTKCVRMARAALAGGKP